MQSKTRWTSYRDIAKKMFRRDRVSIKWKKEFGFAEGNLCTLAITQAISNANLNSCHTSYNIMNDLAKEQPKSVDAKLNLANRLGWLSTGNDKNGKFNLALDYRMKQIAVINQILHIQPENRDYLEMKVRSGLYLAKLQHAQGQTLKASQTLYEIKENSDLLTKIDPKNSKWKMDSDKIHRQIKLIKGV